MIALDKIDIPMVVIGASILFAGVNILIRGNIWNIVLGDERYIIGGIALLAGLCITVLGFRKLQRVK